MSGETYWRDPLERTAEHRSRSGLVRGSPDGRRPAGARRLGATAHQDGKVTGAEKRRFLTIEQVAEELNVGVPLVRTLVRPVSCGPCRLVAAGLGASGSRT